MNLKNKFDNKLNSLKSYEGRANEAFLDLKRLLKNFVSQEMLDEDVIRLFAIKENELPDIKFKLEKLITTSYTFQKHRDIICSKEEKIAKALILMEKLEDESLVFIAEVKAIILFLQNKLN